MCPECFVSIALLVTGAISTEGVTAAALKIFRNHKAAAKISEARKPELHKSKEKLP